MTRGREAAQNTDTLAGWQMHVLHGSGQRPHQVSMLSCYESSEGGLPDGGASRTDQLLVLIVGQD